MTPRNAWKRLRLELYCEKPKSDGTPILRPDGTVAGWTFRNMRKCGDCDTCKLIAVLDAHFAELS